MTPFIAGKRSRVHRAEELEEGRVFCPSAPVLRVNREDEEHDGEGCGQGDDQSHRSSGLRFMTEVSARRM
jgi:hypothetical protein